MGPGRRAGEARAPVPSRWDRKKRLTAEEAKEYRAELDAFGKPPLTNSGVFVGAEAAARSTMPLNEFAKIILIPLLSSPGERMLKPSGEVIDPKDKTAKSFLFCLNRLLYECRAQKPSAPVSEGLQKWFDKFMAVGSELEAKRNSLTTHSWYHTDTKRAERREEARVLSVYVDFFNAVKAACRGAHIPLPDSMAATHAAESASTPAALYRSSGAPGLKSAPSMWVVPGLGIAMDNTHGSGAGK